jgi:hypothetical protein
MRFAAKPVAPVQGEVTEFIKNENYLREALHQRLTAGDGSNIEFAFQVQVRSVESLAGNVDTAIEGACFDWDAEQHPSNTSSEKYPFVTVARITIPPQDCSTAERRDACERLTSPRGMDFWNIGPSAVSIACAGRSMRPRHESEPQLTRVPM